LTGVGKQEKRKCYYNIL